MEEFLKYEQDPNSGFPLPSALKWNCIKGAERLLQEGANPNIANMAGVPPLHYVLSDSSKDCLRPMLVLLQNGANPNLSDTEGLTPLHFIVKKNDDMLAMVFFDINEELNQLVQVDAQDKFGNTPLHLALRYDCMKLAELLLKRGVNPNLSSKEGLTSLHVICNKTDDSDLMIFLKTFFEINNERHELVEVNARDKFGQTPLQIAANNLLPDVVDVLFDQVHIKFFH
ncbi:unnamed protein product [Trichogramma brassicae]|uniref:Uncharacterized protein n=1 Tax=Trichogramma brassicae TaxID=86971 RepID=A0A6H5IDH7_9HYME|nr:unnamed protein product [Trichogramma brassicae]